MSTPVTLANEVVHPSYGQQNWRVNPLQHSGGSLALELGSESISQGTCTHAKLADLALCKIESGSHPVTHAIHNAQDRFGFTAFMQLNGCSVLNQCNKATPLGAGDWCVLQAAHPCSLSISRGSEVLLLWMRAEENCYAEGKPATHAIRKFSGSRGVGKLASQFAMNVFEEAATLGETEKAQLADAIIQMVRTAALSESAHEEGPPSECSFRDRIKSYISSHMQNPEMCIDDLAAALNCSKRYLHKSFKIEGKSISEYIQRQRLERSREILMSPTSSNISITDIAYTWGFNSSSHFSRCFKEVFGETPSSLRARVANQLARSSRIRGEA